MATLYQEQYVWRLPVRWYHWINALSVTVLFLTGIYIATPLFAPAVGEATWYHQMAWIRYIHFGTAFIFIANFLFRLYWGLFGKDPYARFTGFKPWKPIWWGKPFRDQLASYFFLRKDEPNYCGHNPVAALTYFLFVFCGSLFMIFTGLAMYSESNPDGFLNSVFGWVIPLFGGSMRVHTVHHLVAWAFVVFLILHLYAIVRHDIMDKSSVTSSMITGYKTRVEECPEYAD